LEGSILMLVERLTRYAGTGSATSCCWSAGEASWWSFSEWELTIIAKTAMRFARELREAGFPPVRDGMEKGLIVTCRPSYGVLYGLEGGKR
jgi:hypothetical protein